MAETLTLTTPIQLPPQTTIRLERVVLDVALNSLTFQWLWSDNSRGAAVYTTPAPATHPTQPTGTVLLGQLNLGDFRSISLLTQILKRLQLDGYLPPGAVSG